MTLDRSNRLSQNAYGLLKRIHVMAPLIDNTLFYNPLVFWGMISRGALLPEPPAREHGRPSDFLAPWGARRTPNLRPEQPLRGLGEPGGRQANPGGRWAGPGGRRTVPSYSRVHFCFVFCSQSRALPLAYKMQYTNLAFPKEPAPLRPLCIQCGMV